MKIIKDFIDENNTIHLLYNKNLEYYIKCIPADQKLIFDKKLVTLIEIWEDYKKGKDISEYLELT